MTWCNLSTWHEHRTQTYSWNLDFLYGYPLMRRCRPQIIDRLIPYSNVNRSSTGNVANMASPTSTSQPATQHTADPGVLNKSFPIPYHHSVNATHFSYTSALSVASLKVYAFSITYGETIITKSHNLSSQAGCTTHHPYNWHCLLPGVKGYPTHWNFCVHCTIIHSEYIQFNSNYYTSLHLVWCTVQLM